MADGRWWGEFIVKDGEFMGELVRCKDCIHYWKNKPSDDVPVCLASPKDDAFCSEGERIEDDTERSN